MHNQFLAQVNEIWNELLKAPPPRCMRDLKVLPFSKLKAAVQEKDLSAIRTFVESVYAGDAYVLEGAASPDYLSRLKAQLQAFSTQNASEALQVLDGVPDFHSLVDKPAGPRNGYVAIDHSYYFFRWNSDPFEIFASMKEEWRTIKQMGGFSPDEYEKNLPSQRAVDRVQVIHYPKGVGYISAHFDPYRNQRFVWGLELTKIGIDFQSGGFYLYDSGKKKRYVESEVTPGSAVLFFPSLIHGVDIVDEGSSIDWASGAGRWYMALNTVDSHHFSDRVTAYPVPNDF